MRSGSISGSSIDGRPAQRKLSQSSAAPPLSRHSASVFDLNNMPQHQHHHQGAQSPFQPISQVNMSKS